MKYFLALALVFILLIPSFAFAQDNSNTCPIDFESDQTIVVQIKFEYEDENIIFIGHFSPIGYDDYFCANCLMSLLIQDTVWLSMTHSGFNSDVPNPLELLRQYIQGGSQRTNWALFDQSRIEARLASLEGAEVTFFQGENQLVMTIHRATIVPNEMLEDFSADTQAIPEVLSSIDEEYEDLISSNQNKEIKDMLIVSCLWGPFGQRFSQYSTNNSYPSYARYVLWLTYESEEG